MTDPKFPVDSAIQRARALRSVAYAPYSRFSVGAVLIADDGRVFEGCNVENESFGLTMCAERVALGAAVTAGARAFSAVVIAVDGPHAVTPCGACRQVLAEFSPKMLCICVCDSEIQATFQLKDLLPEMPRSFLPES